MQHHGDRLFQRLNPCIQISNDGVQLGFDCRDRCRPVRQRVAVITRLLTHLQQRSAGDQPLTEFVIDVGRGVHIGGWRSLAKCSRSCASNASVFERRGSDFA
jgi:hypothetical protein